VKACQVGRGEAVGNISADRVQKDPDWVHYESRGGLNHGPPTWGSV